MKSSPSCKKCQTKFGSREVLKLHQCHSNGSNGSNNNTTISRRRSSSAKISIPKAPSPRTPAATKEDTTVMMQEKDMKAPTISLTPSRDSSSPILCYLSPEGNPPSPTHSSPLDLVLSPDDEDSNGSLATTTKLDSSGVATPRHLRNPEFASPLCCTYDMCKRHENKQQSMDFQFQKLFDSTKSSEASAATAADRTFVDSEEEEVTFKNVSLGSNSGGKRMLNRKNLQAEFEEEEEDDDDNDGLQGHEMLGFYSEGEESNSGKEALV